MTTTQFFLNALNRNRLLYTALTGSTLLAGFGTRALLGQIAFVRNYVGDALWALMVFWGIGLVFNRLPTKQAAVLAITFAYLIEWSQLYHPRWLDNLRMTRLGGLVLGFTFVWSDLICYALGIAIGVFLERFVIRN